MPDGSVLNMTIDRAGVPDRLGEGDQSGLVVD